MQSLLNSTCSSSGVKFYCNCKALSTGCLKWVLQSSWVKLSEGYLVQGTYGFGYLGIRNFENTGLWSDSFL